jgi:hypothetical protein
MHAAILDALRCFQPSLRAVAAALLAQGYRIGIKHCCSKLWLIILATAAAAM